jgi:hypothetical protein
VLGAALVACVVTLMVISTHFNFFVDEWSFALYKRGWRLGDFFEPHTGHFVLVSMTIYKILFHLVGASHMWPYHLTLALFHVAVVGLVYAIAARRLGPWLALFPAGLMLLPGKANDDLLWPFQICFLGSIAFGLGALLCLDRKSRRGDIAAAALTGLSLASSGVGIPIAIGILVELWLTRRARQRLFVALVPLALFGVWLLAFDTGENQLKLSNLPDLPSFLVKIAGEGFAGFAALPQALGLVLLLAAAGWLGWYGFRHGELPPRTIGAIVAALLFWTLTGMARANLSENYPARYVYVSMVLILVALIPTLPRNPRVPRAAAAALAAIVVFAINDYVELRRPRDEAVLPASSAEWIANVEGDPYIAMYEDLDFPIADAAEIEGMSESRRHDADETVARAERISILPAEPADLEDAVPAAVPALHSLRKSRATVAGLTCTRLTATASDPLAAFPVPAGSTLVFVAQTSRDPKIVVNLRRFSANFLTVSLPLEPGLLEGAGSAAAIRFPRDRSNVGWWVRLEFAGPVGLCLS